MHPTVAANQQHRTDYAWARTGKGQYENYDGVRITRDHNHHGWRITHPDGTNTGQIWPTLTEAKYQATREQ